MKKVKRGDKMKRRRAPWLRPGHMRRRHMRKPIITSKKCDEKGCIAIGTMHLVIQRRVRVHKSIAWVSDIDKRFCKTHYLMRVVALAGNVTEGQVFG